MKSTGQSQCCMLRAGCGNYRMQICWNLEVVARRAAWIALWAVMALVLVGCDDDRSDGSGSATVAVAVPGEVSGAVVVAGSARMAYDMAVSVQSNSGMPLAGALVQVAVQGCAGSTVQQANTDYNGWAVFGYCAEPGTWVFIDAYSTGFADSAVDVVLGGDPYPEVPLYLAPLVVAVR